MEMYYLILQLCGVNSAVIIPEKYTKEQCEKLKDIGCHSSCVSAPKNNDYCKYHFESFAWPPITSESGIAITKKVCD